ncbi:MAG TPA: flagellar filament capping protein FliD [Kofleriaceae bacterium]|nr:flagellar filament capping protein FliD [Kofleriaceae bacterium]
MTAVTFSGLSSGLDTSALVKQLVAAERAPADVVASRQSDISSQKSIVSSLSSALAALGTAARGMDQASELQPRTAASSDAHVTVAASSGAAATVHDIRVKQLARGQITASREFTSSAAGVLGSGSLTIGVGDAAKTIEYGSTDSLADIASKINNSGATASASVLFDGTSYRLMVASTATGTAAAPVFSDGGDGLDLSNPDNIKVPAQNAIATIDGVQVTRGSNVISDAIDGLTMTLVSPHALADADASISVTQDTGSMRDKLKALVTAYNAVNSALHTQLDYTGSKKGGNTLFGDSTLRQLQGALGSVMSAGYGDASAGPEAALTVGGVGLVRAKDGSLTLDEAKLNTVLSTNPNAVTNLFATGGFATAVTNLADSYTRSGDGIFAIKTKGLADRNSVLQTQADHINDRADKLQTQLEAQFTALETAMTKLKSQSSFLTSVLG